MHEFYNRMQSVFERAGSNRNQFCKKYGYNYQTLQAYWNTDKLPPGNVLEDLSKEYNVSMDALVLGRKPQEAYSESPVVNRITRFLREQDEDNLLRLEGAMKMFQYMTLSGSPSSPVLDDAGRVLMGFKYDDEPVEIMPVKIMKVMGLLSELSRHIKDGNMKEKDKKECRGMLGQIVRNIYERELKDEWAQLEELE